MTSPTSWQQTHTERERALTVDDLAYVGGRQDVPQAMRQQLQTETQKNGVRYERKLVEWLMEQRTAGAVEEVMPDVWLDYRTTNGTAGVAQIDVLVWPSYEREEILVLEAKFTSVWWAFEKLEGLYVPLMRKLAGDDPTLTPVQVCAVVNPHEVPKDAGINIASSLAEIHPGERNLLLWRPNA